jgi:hypothetical protein
LTGQQTLIARAALGVFAGAASIAACSSALLRRLPGPRFDRLATIAFYVSRFGLFGLIFFVLRIAPRGDVPGYYWPEANSALHGLLPYRDFLSSYAPLHSYLDAAAIGLWHNPLAIIFLAILAEAAILPLWLRFGRTFLSETELRTATLLYLTNAVSLQFVAVDGQDTVIVGVFLALSLFFLARQKEMFSGASLGAAVSTIKFLPLLFAPAFFLALSKRWRWAVGMMLPIVVVYGAFVAMRLPILTPLQREGNLKGAGNLPYVIESVFGVNLPSRLWDGILLVVLAILFFFLARAARGASPAVRIRVITFSLAALTMALLIFSKKSWTSYLMLTLFPICLLIEARRRFHLLLFALLGVIAVVEHSYWASILIQATAGQLHQGLIAGRPACFIFLTLELLLLAGYVWLLGLSLQCISSAQDGLPAGPPARRAVTS